MTERTKSRRGFAALSPEERKEMARKGGIQAHKLGVAHEFTSDEARAAGRKGGSISRGGRGKVTGGNAAPNVDNPVEEEESVTQ